MSTTGASGYVVKAEAFTNLLPKNLRKKFTQAIADQDTELVDKILGENAPKVFPTFESSFVLNDEDDTDSLEKGVVYICFQEEDLYSPKTPRPEFEWLQKEGIDPKFERWTVWG
jgi:hypothetical protein